MTEYHIQGETTKRDIEGKKNRKWVNEWQVMTKLGKSSYESASKTISNNNSVIHLYKLYT